MESNENSMWEQTPWQMTAAETPEDKPAFVPTRTERVGAFVSYLLAYLYVYIFTSSWGNELWGKLLLGLFTLAFCGAAAWVHRDRKRSVESVCWLVFTAAALGAILFSQNRVWEDLTFLLLHGFAMYYVTARADLLASGRSSIFFPVDVFHTVILYPFRHFFLRARSAWNVVSAPQRRRKGASIQPVLFSLGAVAVGILLLVLAGRLLAAADANFSSLVRGLRIEWDTESLGIFLVRLAFSIPVGSYLFGLVCGTHREQPEIETGKGEGYSRSLAKARKVPAGAWMTVIAVLCAMYLVFLGLQASYLFGAFFHRLPENFTVAGYARQGFFEVCRVMGLNFLLLLLAEKTCSLESHGIKILCTVLLALSALFAITAMSKLGLYISIFGITPLRIQSSWLVFCLTVGCLCAGIHLWTGRRTFRSWLLISGAALTATLFL